MQGFDSLRWVAVQFLTGKIICDLPGIEVPQPLTHSIGQTETTNLVLHLDDSTPPEWETATLEGYAALIAWNGDPSNPVIMGGGVVTQNVRDPFLPQVQLQIATPDIHLGAVYVGSLVGSANQDTLVADLMAFAMGANMPPWILIHTALTSTQSQTVNYSPSSSATVLSALQALSAYNAGPEWVSGWQWDVAAGTISPTLTYGARIGLPADPILGPMVVLESGDMQPGSALTGDYTSGHGANQFTAIAGATSSASSSVASATATAPDLAGRPLWAYAYTPSMQLSDPTALAQYAASAITQLSNGSRALAVVIAINLAGKKYGVDWNLGDDIGWILTGPAFPNPLSGTSRVVSVRVDHRTATPVLQGVIL